MAGGAKPAWRQHDAIPKRGDDIHIKFMGVEVDASGRTVTTVLVAIIAGLLVAGGFWVMTEQHKEMSVAMATLTCVITLDPEERKGFRQFGWYCGENRKVPNDERR